MSAPDPIATVREHLTVQGIAFTEPAAGVFSFSLPGERKLQTAVRLDVEGEGAKAATAEIFDLSGRRVRQLPGVGESFVWDGRDETGGRAADGIYFVRVAAGAETVVARVVVLERR